MSFLTIGHRGMMGVEPENTLRSFVRAEHEGLDVIELDLHLSKDGALVVMHDADVDRTTDGAGPIVERTLAELRELDAGQGERIPVFEEVVAAVKAPLQAEIKDVAAAQALAEVMRSRDLVGRVDVISFHDEALAAIRTLLPGVRTALVASRYGADVVDRALAVGATMLSLNIRRLTLELVERARAAQLKVVAWTVNTHDQLRLARGLGLDGVVTDMPEIRRAVRFTA
ncbi:glycerophosphodiester phosphodiesterase [Streptomyces tubercidicus]|uniref:glycerophosphodiester phosphodiesterase n=1 Tax=Streptomyces tubercidicus TaxID=47759 RepID=UPI002E0DC9D1|nr:glycerophosphodiester phosphodiesterase family protein [Streptomyces tubercidicus]